jgi:flagellar hook protein FlgE
MSSALTSALTGLRVHQLFLDVVGNNLANSSTVGFHSSRITFSDLLSQTLRTGAGPSSTLGGIDPMQVGMGVQVHSIDIRNQQGVLDSTGRPFDLGIDGEGFFVLDAGTRDVYTRAGVFGLDSGHNLVDTATGFKVRGVDGQDINLPIDTLLPAQATSTIALGGNLPAKVGGPVAEVLSTSSPFQSGTAASLTGANSGPFTFTNGDSMDVRVDGGSVQTVTLLASDFTAIGSNIASATAADVATVLQSKLTGVSVSASGNQVVLTSNRTGTASTLEITDGTGSPASVLGLSTTLTRGTDLPVSATTDLSDLNDNLADYVNGDQLQISGTDANGLPVSATFTYGTDGTTLGDLATFLDNLLPGATVSLDASGNLVATANATGDASLSLSIVDAAGNTGSTTFGSHGFAVTTEGAGPDTARTSLDVFDTRGLRHTVTLTFTRTSGTDWDVAATTDDANDVVVDGSISGVRFNEDGSFFAVTGTGAGDSDLEITFNGLTTTQTIAIGMGTSGQFDGVTQLGDTTSLAALSQDGYAAGALASVAVNSDGTIVGSYDNGQQQDLGQVALAIFANPSGLVRRGNTMFEESQDSGVAQLQSPANGRAGTILDGALEQSNVDVAEEFVRLIEAQRGFQANARVIRVSDELLQELVNIV